MKKILIKINRKIINGISVLKSIYKLFLESIYFWVAALFAELIFLMYIPYVFYKIHLILGLLFSFFSIFFLFTLIPAIYYKIRGVDFFSEMIKLENIKKDSFITNCNINSRLTPSNNLIIEFYNILRSASLIDETMVGEKGEIDLVEVFSFDYIKSFIEEVSEKGNTEKKLYLSTNQKITAYILFDVIRPLIQRDVKSFCHLVYYSQKNNFKNVKYQSISDTNKRGVDAKVEILLPEFLKKIRLNQ